MSQEGLVFWLESSIAGLFPTPKTNGETRALQWQGEVTQRVYLQAGLRARGPRR
jgi:hypothetical protein